MLRRGRVLIDGMRPVLRLPHRFLPIGAGMALRHPLRPRVSTRYLPDRVTSSRTRIRQAVVSRKPDARSGGGISARCSG